MLLVFLLFFFCIYSMDWARLFEFELCRITVCVKNVQYTHNGPMVSSVQPHSERNFSYALLARWLLLSLLNVRNGVTCFHFDFHFNHIFFCSSSSFISLTFYFFRCHCITFPFHSPTILRPGLVFFCVLASFVLRCSRFVVLSFFVTVVSEQLVSVK